MHLSFRRTSEPSASSVLSSLRERSPGWIWGVQLQARILCVIFHAWPQAITRLHMAGLRARGLHRWLSGKKPPASVGDARDAVLILGLGRSPGGGNGNPLQYSCWDNLKDRGDWWATVQEITKSQTWLNTYPRLRGSCPPHSRLDAWPALAIFWRELQLKTYVYMKTCIPNPWASLESPLFSTGYFSTAKS